MVRSFLRIGVTAFGLERHDPKVFFEPFGTNRQKLTSPSLALTNLAVYPVPAAIPTPREGGSHFPESVPLVSGD